MTHDGFSRRAALRGAAVATIGVSAGASQACAQPDSAASPAASSNNVQPFGAGPPEGYRWVPQFSDNFAAIDTALWYRYDNNYGTGSQSAHWLRPRNVVADGTLKVVSKRERYRGREFTSGFLSTAKRGGHAEPAPEHDTYFPRSGFYEISGKVTHAQGLLQACWLRHRNGASVAEVDLMETFHCQEPGKTRQTLHLNGVHNTFSTSTFIEDPAAKPGWHVWGVAITEEDSAVRFRFYTDGALTGEYRAHNNRFWHGYSNPNLWDISIDTYVGGVWVGHPDDPLGYSRYNGGFCLSSGQPPRCDSTNLRAPDFPTTFEVDYVRVWNLTHDE